jgi:dipeptidyl aminopeptidase/acylaminoacyl peptidase
VDVTEDRLRIPLGPIELAGVLHLPAVTPSPCVVACHGMGASKDSDKYLLLGGEYPAGGLALFRFDFRGSGESGGAFDEATVESRIEDLEAVLDALAKHPALTGRPGLLGSSLGGFVALWVASRRRGLPLVTWNAPAALHDLARQDPADPAGPGRALVAEVLAGRHAEVPRGATHALVIQAEADEVVPPRHGRAIWERVGEPRALQCIPGADHRLSDPAHRRAAVAASLAWHRRHLLGAAA